MRARPRRAGFVLVKDLLDRCRLNRFLLRRFWLDRSGRRHGRGVALHFCKLFSQTRELFVRALDLFVGVRQPFIGQRDRGIRGFSRFPIR